MATRPRFELPNWAIAEAFWAEYENVYNEIEHLNGELILEKAFGMIEIEKDNRRLLDNLDD